nr:unnamed protein product [Callosobruchus chinensis]
MEGLLCSQLEDFYRLCNYCSPNVSIEQFEHKGAVNDSIGEDIILGDLNAESSQWDSPVTDRKGGLLCDLIAEMDIMIFNDGITPTFSRGFSSSYIEVTLASPEVARKFLSWNV